MNSSRRLVRTIPWIAVIIALLILVAMAALYSLDYEAFKRSLEEDAVIEWLTLIGFFLAGIIFLITAAQERKWRGSVHWFLGLLGMLCLFIALEEANWGQRAFNLTPPELIKRYGYKNNISFHNTMRALLGIRSKKYAAPIMTLYAVILPLLNLNNRVSSFLERKRIVAPPIQLSAVVLFGASMQLAGWPQRRPELSELLYALPFLTSAIVEFAELNIAHRTPALQDAEPSSPA